MLFWNLEVFGKTEKIRKNDHLVINPSFHVTLSIIFEKGKFYTQVYSETKHLKPSFIEIGVLSTKLWVSKFGTTRAVISKKLTISPSECNLQIKYFTKFKS